MRNTIFFLAILLASCSPNEASSSEKTLPIIGTWELVAAQKTQKGETKQDDLSGKRMIKVINGSHFAFLNHDLVQEGDSLDFFVSGGGTYTLTGNQYQEHLE